jgi:bifunctional UDP-N-acetylglucosamine pyrophosphorylase / glucosamine-1-phosphate N-acetyltransferase
MRSSMPKVLHHVAGRSLLGHVIEAASGLEPAHVLVVVGHGRERVVEHLAEWAPWCLTVTQEEQRGTAHALRRALEDLAARQIDVRTGPIMVLTGDTPLLTTQTLRELLDEHERMSAAATVLTAHVDDPTGYGRVIRDVDGRVRSIVEEADASEPERLVTEINAGMYTFDADVIESLVNQVSTDNAQGEEYLTDVIALLHDARATVAAWQVSDPMNVLGVNDRQQLAFAAAIMRDRINASWMRQGVAILDTSTTWLDVDVDLAADVTILPNTTLRGPTSVATGAHIGPGTTLASCEVGENATVIHTWAELAVVGPDARVGPFTYLRPGAVLGAGAKAGAFVEVKNASVGDGAKIPHLSYVGDATIGAGSNIGAGSVFVNYDGIEKHRTVIGEHVRIGSDTMLVAPVTIGDGAYTAAGSVITEDVPPGAMGVGRARQRNIRDWVLRRRSGTESAKAASSADQANPQEEM